MDSRAHEVQKTVGLLRQSQLSLRLCIHMTLFFESFLSRNKWPGLKSSQVFLMSHTKSRSVSPTISKIEDSGMYVLEDKDDDALFPINRKVILQTENINPRSTEYLCEDQEIEFTVPSRELNNNKRRKKCERSDKNESPEESLSNPDGFRRSPRIKKIQMFQKICYRESFTEASEDENDNFKPRELANNQSRKRGSPRFQKIQTVRKSRDTQPFAENFMDEKDHAEDWKNPIGGLNVEELVKKAKSSISKFYVKLLPMSHFQLLKHGLLQNDEQILDLVLSQIDEDIINNVVAALPKQMIPLLLKVLQNYIMIRGPLVFAHGKWLKIILHHHSAYLVSSPEYEAILASMNATIEAKTRSYDKILQVRGKIEMMLEQIRKNPGKSNKSKDEMHSFVESEVLEEKPL